MEKALIIIVTGPPGAGKTTLSHKIAEEFSLPVLNRDGIKESLFESLGSKDKNWSHTLGKASYGILYYFMDILLSKKISFIVESNFKPEFENEKFIILKNKYEVEFLQIHCHAETKILFQRFKSRYASGERHSGHVDNENYDEFEAHLSNNAHGPLNIGGKIVDLDTTDFKNIDHELLFEEINSIKIKRKFRNN